MPGKAFSLLLDHVSRLAGASVPDDQLLADFLARRDEAAFAALVGRHGPMVLNLCRRVLLDAHAAEDVFQATFLVLADRAAAIRCRVSLGSWLHGVAYRLAVRAKRRRAASARPAGDLRACDSPGADPAEGLAWQEMLAILDEELARLPERYRSPLILCYLDGRTRDEAAHLLGWSVGTFRRRLEQGRDLLQTRLRGRGVSLTAALGGLLAGGAVAVPAPLQAATVAALSAMTQGGWVMLFGTVKKLILGMVVCGLAIGAGLWAYAPRRSAPPTPATTGQVAAAGDAVQQAADAVEACEPRANAYLLMELAIQEAKRGNAANARKRFEQAADRFASTTGYERGIILVMMAYRLADAGDPASATKLLEEARQLAVKITKDNERSEVLRFATVCCAEKIDPAKALAWAKDIPEENTRLNAYRNIAAAQAAAGDVAGAQRTVEQIRTPYGYFKLIPWEAIVAAQLKAGDRAGAEATLRDALEVVEQSRQKKWGDWLATRVSFLIHYATAQAKAGDKKEAVATLERVEKVLADAGRPTSLATLADLARGFAEAGDRAKAEGAVRRFLKAAESVEEKELALVPLIPARIALGDHDGAAKMARRIHNPQELHEVCQTLTEAGQKEAALAVAREAKTPELRAWGLLGVGRGVLNLLPPERIPAYRKGTFALVIPNKPAVPDVKPAESAPTPEQQMRAAVDKWEQAWAKFNERLEKATTPAERQKLLETARPGGDECANQLLALAREHAGQPFAFDALARVVEYTSYTPAAREALTLLLNDHVASKKIGDLCSIAALSIHRHEAEKLLRAVLAKGPHDVAKGQACLALARFVHNQASHARFVQQKPEPKDAPMELRRLRAADPAKLEAEAVKLYERVLAEFADVFPSRHGETLGKTARAALDEIRLLAIGRAAPEIEGKDLDGKPMKLSEHRGKVVVLVFWATWCAPCRAMIPHERALVKRLAGRPFVLLGVNGDSDADALGAWRKKNPLPWRSWSESEKVARAWNVTAWPTVYVLDTKGVIRHRDVFDKELDDAVDSLVKAAEAAR